MTTFTFLQGERPNGFTIEQGHGFAGNFGYWYITFVAEPPTFTDFWLTEIAGGVRLNVGELARFSDEVDETQHYFDFLGETARLSAKGNLLGQVTQVDMGAVLGGEDVDFFRISDSPTTAKAWRKAIDAFLEAPDDNIDFWDALTFEVSDIVGETELDNHGGFPSETNLRSMSMGDGNDVAYWQGLSTDVVTLDGGEGRDLLRVYTEGDVRLSVPNGRAIVGDARADFTGFEIYVTELGDDTLIGTDGDDHLRSLGGRNRLIGRDGDDHLTGGLDRDLILGGDDADILSGSSGNDRLRGGRGDDTLAGGLDNDTLKGGAGADTFVIDRDFRISPVETQTDLIVDFDPALDRLDLTDFRSLGDLDAVRAIARNTEDGLRLALDDKATVILRDLTKNALTEDALILYI